MKIGATEIVDTFAEAFAMRYVRMIVTAQDDYWLDAMARGLCGYSSSVIACDAEIAVECRLEPEATPDGRAGVAVLAFGFSAAALAGSIPNRVGQCVMTCPTTAVYDGLAEPVEKIPLGKHIRFFGDGYQRSKKLLGARYWRIPVMDGEFVVRDTLGVAGGIGGGNMILQADTAEHALAAARRAAEAIAPLAGVIAPFPGGVVRSGSKVGSVYKKLPASTADAYCPTLRGRTETQLYDGVHCVYEIVIDGTDEESISSAMQVGIRAAAGEGVIAIGAGNYGGKLGKHHFHLHQLLAT